jgi:AcrR family transcriptional regulator
MSRDSAATKTRILDAATVEFAAHGLAGARVDRLASRAGANKQLIYAYFGSKEALFDATAEMHIDRLLDEVPFDASDLPAYAQKLFDFGTAHPELLRLARWHTLERPGVLMRLPHVAASTLRKVEALAAAQADGKVDDTLAAEDLLGVLLAIIHGGEESQPLDEDGKSQGLDARRHAIGHAVRRLIEPRPRD